jgi:hypothetical protein
MKGRSVRGSKSPLRKQTRRSLNIGSLLEGIRTPSARLYAKVAPFNASEKTALGKSQSPRAWMRSLWVTIPKSLEDWVMATEIIAEPEAI